MYDLNFGLPKCVTFLLFCHWSILGNCSSEVYHPHYNTCICQPNKFIH